jgi:cell division protein FtsB
MSTPLPQGRVRVQRIAEAAVERARLTVVPRTRRVRAARVPFVTLVSLILLGGVVGLLMFNTSMQQNAFKAAALETEAADLQSTQQALEQEIDKLRDPQRIGEWARTHGYQLPSCPSFLILPSGKLSGEPCMETGDLFNPMTPPARKPDVLVPEKHIVHAKATSATSGKKKQGQNGDTQRQRAAAGE